MILDELVYHQQRMLARGCSREEIVAFGEEAKAWREQQKLARQKKRQEHVRIDTMLLHAVEAALFPVLAAELLAENANNPPVESVEPKRGDKTEPTTGDKFVPPSVRLGPKQAARKAVLHAPGLRGQTCAVWAAVIDRADGGSGDLAVSLRRLALDAGLVGRDPARAVQRALRVGEGFGLIVPTGHKHRGTARPYRVLYEAFRQLLAELEGPADGRWHPACFRGAERALELARAAATGDKTAAERVTKAATGDTHVPQTLKRILPSVTVESHQRARGRFAPPLQPQLPGMMGIVGGTDSRRQKALRRAERAILAKHPRFGPEIHGRLAGLDAIDRNIVADAELDQAGDGCRTLECIIGLGRGPPRTAGTG